MTTLVDGIGHLWSLKLVFAFKKRLGDYLSIPFSKVEKLLVNIRTLLASVNLSYERLASFYAGSYQTDELPTWSNPRALFLDDKCRWSKELLQTNEGVIEQEYIQVLTGPRRGLWMSSGLSPIHAMSAQLGEDGVYQMLICLAWQNTFTHFYHVCLEMDLTALSPGPIYEYYRVAHRLFYVEGREKGQEMYVGIDPRFSCVSINFPEVFGTQEKPTKGKIDSLVCVIKGLCTSINEIVQSTVGEVDHEMIVGEIKAAAAACRSTAAAQLGEFRLMLILQACVHLGLGFTPSRQLRNIFLPVEGSGSWEHMTEFAGAEPGEHIVICKELQRQLSDRDGMIVMMDEVEAMLCEGKPGRILQKFDRFIKGQSLFMVDDEGVPWMLPYGKKNWEKVALFNNVSHCFIYRTHCCCICSCFFVICWHSQVFPNTGINKTVFLMTCKLYLHDPLVRIHYIQSPSITAVCFGNFHYINLSLVWT